jgi:hypothetical protein
LWRACLLSHALARLALSARCSRRAPHPCPPPNLPAALPPTAVKALRIKDLKAIMAEKNIACPECIEKADYVRKLEQVLGGGKAAAGGSKTDL